MFSVARAWGLVVAWTIVFEPKGRPGETDICLCFTKFETSLQMKKFVEGGIAVHEIRKDGTIVFDRAQIAGKFRVRTLAG